MQPLAFVTPVVNGKTNCGAQLNLALSAFNGKTVKITIKELKRGRSNSQNGFYWACVVPVIVDLLLEYGNDVDCDLAHEFLKHKFMPPEGIVSIWLPMRDITFESGFERNVEVCRTSTRLSTMAFEEYIERIRAFAAEHNYKVPFVNEGLYD